MRFDDTNPSKEKEEYEESILEDVKTLDIRYKVITHTSDHFELIIKRCTEVIQRGLAYADKTEHEQMKKERMDGIESIYRNTTPEENLKIWEEMQKGNLPEYCIRIKIDMQCKNKCMRDPVIFRHCTTPHQRTGTKFKVYPVYDFACPIVDSEEGVTYALRSNEYADRNHLYNWILKTLNLNPVKIMDFSRLNFVSTTLSKRKLGWFVDKNIVDGWTDPRFPTVKGILRRGMLVQTLIEFMLEQGPSKNTNLMEWDKIWALNRKNIDPIAVKYTAISKKGIQKLIINNFDLIDQSIIMTPLHPKLTEVGDKPVHKTQTVIIEKEDLSDLKEGDKIVLVKWGVFTIKTISKLENDISVIIEANPEDMDFKAPKKLTWLPYNSNYLIDINVLEYDHLLNVLKPDEIEDFSSFVNYNSKFSTEFLAEGHMKALEIGSILQFERRGYFIVDKKSIVDNNKLVIDCISIPDGKSKTMSGLATNVDAKLLQKGNK